MGGSPLLDITAMNLKCRLSLPLPGAPHAVGFLTFMKTTPIILALTLITIPTLRAQLVADGATNTLSNVTNTIIGDVTVGTNGSFTVLVLSDNALLTNSGAATIGFN